MKHVTVFRDNAVYASHASACVAANGEVLVAFRQAPLEQVFAHVHPEATVGVVRSANGGDTWDRATWATALDPGEETNLNDPSLTTLRDGTIILTAFVFPCPRESSREKWGDRALPVRGNDYYYVGDDQHILLSRSFDNGLTWDGPHKIVTPLAGGRGSVFASVVELSDGSILMPINGRSDDGEHVAILARSTDKGLTWEHRGTMAAWHSNEESGCLGLPSVVAYDDDHLLAAGWSVVQSGTVVTESYDGGRTWIEPREVETRGACMHLCASSGGDTILSYGYRHEPYGIRVIPSGDRGKTWDLGRAAALRSEGAMRDLGYPWTIELPDGRFLCAYYFNTADDDKSYYDEAESLRLCRQWKLDPPLYTYQTAGLRFIGATIFTRDDMARLAGTASPDLEDGAAGPTLI